MTFTTNQYHLFLSGVDVEQTPFIPCCLRRECERCRGSGVGQVAVKNPDWDEEPVMETCGRCGGSGSIVTVI